MRIRSQCHPRERMGPGRRLGTHLLTQVVLTTSHTRATPQTKRPSKSAGPSDCSKLSGLLFKTAERFCFVVIDIKNSQQLGDHEQILHLLSQVEQL